MNEVKNTISIDIHNLTKEYGTQTALDDVSLSINEGEIVGLLGPNGAGKSTMMKIITCFIPATKGEVKVYNYDTNEEPMKIRSLIGYLPEQNPLYNELYVRENLEFIAGIHGIKGKEAKQRVEQMIEKVQYKQSQAIKYCNNNGLQYQIIYDEDIGFDSTSMKRYIKNNPDIVKKYSITFLSPERMVCK